MPNNIAALRTLETSYLRSGGLDATEAADLVAKAKASGNPEDMAAVRDMFAHDAFDAKVDPNAALKAAKVTGKVQTSQIAGKKVGSTTVNGKAMDVTVTRTFGNPEGYANKFQALATARLSGEGNMVVAQDAKGRWHAAQTGVKADTLVSPAFQPAPVNQAAYDTLQKSIHDRVAANPRDTMTADEARKLASFALGVPEAEINVINQPLPRKLKEDQSSLDPERININLGDTANGHTFHVHSEACGCARVDQPSKLVLTPALLMAGPDRIAETTFHEGAHYADNQMAGAAVKKWGGSLDSEKSHQAFNSWLDKQPATAFTKAEKVAITNLVGARSKGSIEATAYVRSFLAAVEKDPAGATNQLLGFGEYENDLRPDKLDPKTKKPIPDPDPRRKGQALRDEKVTINAEVRKALIGEMKARFEKLPPAAQENFRKAVARLDDAYPATHLSEAMGFKKP